MGFLLGLAAFVLSLRNMRTLQELKRAQSESERAVDPDPPGAAGAADAGHFSAGNTSSSGTSH